MEYVDLQAPEAKVRHAEVLKAVQDRLLSLPLVAIDGELVLAGTAHYYHVLPLVERVLSRS